MPENILNLLKYPLRLVDEYNRLDKQQFNQLPEVVREPVINYFIALKNKAVADGINDFSQIRLDTYHYARQLILEYQEDQHVQN